MSQGLYLHDFLLQCLGTLIQGTVEPRCGGAPLWNTGLKEVASEKLVEMGVPKDPITFVTIARTVGILGPDPNVIEVPNRSPKRRTRRV